MTNRLDILALRGTSGVDTAVPLMRIPPIGTPPGKLGVVQGPGTITFTLNAVPRWVIDIRRFAGTPALTLTLGLGHRTTITLGNALLPGTQLPADFVLIVDQTGPLGTPADITFTLGGFHAEVLLEDWLAGTQVMRAPVSFGSDVCPLGVTSKLAVSGSGQAQFLPNWLMAIGGPSIAAISGLGSGIATDSFTLRLLFPGDPTISLHPKARRALLSLAPGSHVWDLPPEVANLGIGQLAARAGLYATIDVEVGEGPTGDVARELLATSASATGLALSVAGDISDLDGHPFVLTLASPRYAIAFDASADHSEGDQTFLTARFALDRAWLVADGVVAQVGDVPGAPAFEVETLKGVVTSLSCAPALLMAAAPITVSPGESVATRPLPVANARLTFVATPGSAPGWGILAGPEVPGQRRISLPDFAVSVLRRDDLLALDFLFFNLALEAGGGKPPQLTRKDPAQPSYVAIRFDQPQNITEQSYLEAFTDTPGHPAPPGGDQQNFAAETPGSDPAFPLIAPARAAGPSQLAFRLPSGTDSLPYTLADLLTWTNLEQSVVPVAQAPDPNQTGVPQPPPIQPVPAIRQPQATETAIEVPWRLFLSPNYSGAWAHWSVPVTLGGRTELWHTRLAVRLQQKDGFSADETIPRWVRAVWSPDYSPGAIPPHAVPPFNQTNAPFRTSLDPDDRDQIVRLSSDFTMSLAAARPLPYVPISISTDKLYLTSLGAWVSMFGNWPEPLPFSGNAVFSVEQWQHRAAMARDNYVRVVYAGFLLCFGNAASLVKITERKLQSVNGGPTTAYLRQRFYIMVRQPEISYESLPNEQQRNLPYRSITIKTLVTPDVVPAVDALGRYSFFPTTGPGTFLFHIIGTDWEGQTSEFTAPLYFVERGGDFAHAVNAYNASGTGQRDLAGQKIAFAAPNKPGDTTLHAKSLTFSAQPPSPVATAISPFHPQMDVAEVVVPSVQQLTGGSGDLQIVYFAGYLSGGMGPGEVFAQKTGTPLAVGFNGKQSGGVATPNLSVSGLSRKFGTVSGATPDAVAGGTYKAADIFADANAALFGVVKLAELIDDVTNAIGTAPVVTTERLPTQITTTLKFAPQVKQTYSALGGFIQLNFTGDVTNALNLNASIAMPLQGGNSQVSIHGELNDFTLSLGNVIGIAINQIAFDAPAGQKLTVSASMPPTDDNGPIEFLGDLSFLNRLRQLIPSSGFQDPPSLDVSADGITAGYSLPLPSIGVGVFSLENIALSAALTLPFFSPNPIRFRFAFCSREHPFLISVSLLGGGGFFGLTVGPDGVEILEASIEVGANVSIDVVVASGNVHIMAGVYLKFDLVGQSSQLTGYLRAGGSLDVLGLISASVEFYLGFTYYYGTPCSIAGEATVTIEVHVLFFSASVSASLRRQFADPVISFADLIPALPGDPPGTSSIWNYYCDSFAA
jgi:hypothetical protein